MKTNYAIGMSIFKYYPKGIKGKATLKDIAKSSKAMRIIKEEVLLPIEDGRKQKGEILQDLQQKALKAKDKDLQAAQMEVKKKEREFQNEVEDAAKEMIELKIPKDNMKALIDVLSNITKDDMVAETKDKEGKVVATEDADTNDYLNIGEFIEDAEK